MICRQILFFQYIYFRYHGYGHGKGYGSQVKRKFVLQADRKSKEITTLTSPTDETSPKDRISTDTIQPKYKVEIPNDTKPKIQYEESEIIAIVFGVTIGSALVGFLSFIFLIVHYNTEPPFMKTETLYSGIDSGIYSYSGGHSTVNTKT